MFMELMSFIHTHPFGSSQILINLDSDLFGLCNGGKKFQIDLTYL